MDRRALSSTNKPRETRPSSSGSDNATQARNPSLEGWQSTQKKETVMQEWKQANATKRLQEEHLQRIRMGFVENGEQCKVDQLDNKVAEIKGLYLPAPGDRSGTSSQQNPAERIAARLQEINNYNSSIQRFIGNIIRAESSPSPWE